MRLDKYLSEKGYFTSRNQGQEAIDDEKIKVNGKIVLKASFEVGDEDLVEISEPSIYVSRAGKKLEGALKHASIDLNNKVILDIGSSTGGFTQCCLLNGARKVFAVDVGTAQLHSSLRDDVRIVSIENTNARFLTKEKITDPIDVIVMDVSFISGLSIVPQLIHEFDAPLTLIVLIKPQFEVGAKNLNSKGIVTNQRVIEKMLNDYRNAVVALGCKVKDIFPSELTGKEGNQEYFIVFRKTE